MSDRRALAALAALTLLTACRDEPSTATPAAAPPAPAQETP